MKTLSIVSIIFIACAMLSSPAKATSFDEIMKQAESGDAKAQYAVGLAYELGHLIKQDIGKAVVWYRKSASNSFAPAQSALGYLYQSGSGVEQNLKLAVDLYEKAAQNGDIRGQILLGVAYLKGIGVAVDKNTAAKSFYKAAKAGDQFSQLILGKMLIDGSAGEKNWFAAHRWLSKAVKGLDPEISKEAENIRREIDKFVINRGMTPKEFSRALRKAIGISDYRLDPGTYSTGCAGYNWLGPMKSICKLR